MFAFITILHTFNVVIRGEARQGEAMQEEASQLH